MKLARELSIPESDGNGNFKGFYIGAEPDVFSL